MRNAVVAVLYHCSEASTSEARHMFCDTDAEWCKMRQAQMLSIEYIDEPDLPVAVRDKIRITRKMLSMVRHKIATKR